VENDLLNYITCSHEAFARMKEKKTGHIINVGSMSADIKRTGNFISPPQNRHTVLAASRGPYAGFAQLAIQSGMGYGHGLAGNLSAVATASVLA
jgi:NAD(P)-dependent dehydrogenase (short-subunit alcohol dehydrogenase family)